ncbi:MAG: hypothetical protein AUJ96_29010 [Armatimonadetes bacterium CG2_30_66_41]|nr:hypothetical protein [Armatimonadota bacterium]NCP30921.1 hypothetical protein [Armatimonadota bacterium]NCQ28013.1 hypothetical protein [Armatimonadota bacterium]OIO94226.1 MAG: hypothetical protein AUJ96_29010 [Armatimonadetes bacterium CG2_30_66_41]PJB73263.1 MAG: hypothetical protein CO096_06220 [Armatimonadetes bacterium CG_4_9_14_3_um_filter_66_14]
MSYVLWSLLTGWLAPLPSQAETPAGPSPHPRAMWVWDGALIVGEPDEERRLFGLCEAVGVRELFLDATTQLRDSTGSDALRAFLHLAHSRGMRVHGLFGDAGWAMPENHHEALAWLDRVGDFHHNSEGALERFDGVQWDVEPYVLKEWKTDPKALGRGYLGLIQKLLERHEKIAGGTPFEFGLAIPFWWDRDGPDSVFVSAGGTESPLLGCLLQEFAERPGVAVHLAAMAYRTHALGPNSSTAISQREIDTAERCRGNVRVWVGLESTKTEPASITFYGGTWAALANAAAQVDRFFAGRKSYAGVALHHYRSLVRLQGAPVERTEGGI